MSFCGISVCVCSLVWRIFLLSNACQIFHVLLNTFVQMLFNWNVPDETTEESFSSQNIFLRKWPESMLMWGRRPPKHSNTLIQILVWTKNLQNRKFPNFWWMSSALQTPAYHFKCHLWFTCHHLLKNIHCLFFYVKIKSYCILRNLEIMPYFSFINAIIKLIFYFLIVLLKTHFAQCERLLNC